MSLVSLGKYKLIKDPIHGYIRIYSHELPIVDSSAFQRLRRIKQLSIADLVYPGAVHTRFLHSIGVAHVAESLVREALRKANVRESEVERYIVLTRLVALLHDIGHGPFSHTFEDAILFKRGVNHEIMGRRIVENGELVQHIEKIAGEYGYSAKDVGTAISATSVNEWPFKEPIGSVGNEKALFYVIKGAFSADLIDYLLRDSFFTGAGYGHGIDWYRLAYYCYIDSDKIAVDVKAQEVLDQLLIARLYMFDTVYYHKTVRAAAKFITNILTKIDETKALDFDEYVNDVSKYIELDDYSILLKNEIMEKVPEVRDFLARRIPFKAVDEHRISLPELSDALEALLIMSKEFLERAIHEKLSKLGLKLEAGSDFFVDTPKLPLNPMLSDDVVYIKDAGGYIYRKRVLELAWFSIPRTIFAVRLYINRSIADKSELLRTVFREVIRGSAETLRPFY